MRRQRGTLQVIAWMAMSTVGCEAHRMTTTESNKAFITTMLSQKKRLEDFPDRFDPDLVMIEPKTLPFGGTYRGLQEFQRFYPEVRRYYDFETWHVLGVYGDGDTVFATTRVGVAGTSTVMYIAEQFTFIGTKIVEVRVHVCDVPQK
jgi:SnoaL-like domain